MKKLTLALLLTAFTLSGGVAFAIDTPTKDGIIKRTDGTRQSVPVHVFKLVRFANRGANVASLASGDVVKYDTLSDDGVTIATTTTSGDGAIAGIVVTTIPTSDQTVQSDAFDDVGRRNWGYIQVHGPALAGITAGAASYVSVGDPFITSSDAAKIASLQTPTATANSINTIAYQSAASGGFFLDQPAASDTTVEVFITLE